MNRSEARALAKATLQGMNAFAQVYDHEPLSFNGQSPVATAHSKSLGIMGFAHGEIAIAGEIVVTLYFFRKADPADTKGAVIEERLDTLTLDAMLAVRTAFIAADPEVEVNISPSVSGYAPPLDANVYRMERFAVPFEDRISDPAV